MLALMVVWCQGLARLAKFLRAMGFCVVAVCRTLASKRARTGHGAEKNFWRGRFDRVNVLIRLKCCDENLPIFRQFIIVV
jgi:hypothetical protein